VNWPRFGRDSEKENDRKQPEGGGCNSCQPAQNRVLVQTTYNPLKQLTTRNFSAYRPKKRLKRFSPYRPVKRLQKLSSYRPKKTLQPEEIAYNPFLLQPVSQMSNNPNTILGSCTPLQRTMRETRRKKGQGSSRNRLGLSRDRSRQTERKWQERRNRNPY
jgi:hypothetical protein